MEINSILRFFHWRRFYKTGDDNEAVRAERVAEALEESKRTMARLRELAAEQNSYLRRKQSA